MNKAEEFFARRAQQNDILLDRADLSVKRFFALDNAVYKEGEIPAKYKELLGLVASTVLRCDDCITYHIVQAKKEGASHAEIEETLAIALLVGGSITIPHLRIAFDLFETLRN
jgi:ribonuclease HI